MGGDFSHRGEGVPCESPVRWDPVSCMRMHEDVLAWGVACGHRSGSDPGAGEHRLLVPFPRPQTAVPSFALHVGSPSPRVHGPGVAFDIRQPGVQYRESLPPFLPSGQWPVRGLCWAVRTTGCRLSSARTPCALHWALCVNSRVDPRQLEGTCAVVAVILVLEARKLGSRELK